MYQLKILSCPQPVDSSATSTLGVPVTRRWLGPVFGKLCFIVYVPPDHRVADRDTCGIQHHAHDHNMHWLHAHNTKLQQPWQLSSSNTDTPYHQVSLLSQTLILSAGHSLWWDSVPSSPLPYLFLNRTALALFLSSFFQHYFPLFAPLYFDVTKMLVPVTRSRTTLKFWSATMFGAAARNFGPVHKFELPTVIADSVPRATRVFSLASVGHVTGHMVSHMVPMARCRPPYWKIFTVNNLATVF